MAYGDSEAEEMDAALMQERITKWAATATEEAACNKPLRAEIERLQRENAELATAIQTNNEYLVKTEDEWEARCDAFETKLAAAEAALRRKDLVISHILSGVTPNGIAVIVQQAEAAIAKTEPDYCETDETAEFLRREDAAK